MQKGRFMKKKLFCLLFILILPVCFLFSGCKNAETLSTKDFVAISYSAGKDASTTIYIHKETRVMYLYVRSENAGGLTVMLDADGKPLIYEGELN